MGVEDGRCSAESNSFVGPEERGDPPRPEGKGLRVKKAMRGGRRPVGGAYGLWRRPRTRRAAGGRAHGHPGAKR